MDISCVIPVDGRSGYLERSLTTLLRQPVDDFGVEILVIDNSRTDELRSNVFAACQRAASDFPNDGSIALRYLAAEHPNPSHRNVSYPRNVGIRVARSPVVLFADADILHVSETLRQHLSHHRREDNALVYSYCRDCDPQIPLDPGQLRAALSDANYSLRMAASTDWFGGMCFSVRRQRLIEVSGCEESFSRWGYEDYDLARRMRKRGASIIRDDQIQTLHQVHPPQSAGGWLMKLYAGLRQSCAIQATNRGREWGAFKGRPIDLASSNQQVRTAHAG